MCLLTETRALSAEGEKRALVGNLTMPSFGQQILNIPEAHAVSVVEPDGMADDVGRKAMPKVAGPASVHPGIVLGGELT